MFDRVDYLEHCSATRPSDEQVYRTFRGERQNRGGQPSKGSIKIAVIELYKSIQNLDKVIEDLA